VREIGDLQVGMELEGVVTNVTNFGAFVDLGVHQDGLVHVSELSDRWVSDPLEVVKVGDKLKVRVLSVDLERKRIGLTAKRGSGGGGKAKPEARSEPPRGKPAPRNSGGQTREREGGFANNPFAKLRR
jgi:uncharacterized protein